MTKNVIVGVALVYLVFNIICLVWYVRRQLKHVENIKEKALTADHSDLLRQFLMYPELPVVPLVQSTIVKEGNQWGIGVIQDAFVAEYISDGGKPHIRDNSQAVAFMQQHMKEQNQASLSEDELQSAYDNLPWKKAIIVCITAKQKQQ